MFSTKPEMSYFHIVFYDEKIKKVLQNLRGNSFLHGSVCIPRRCG